MRRSEGKSSKDLIWSRERTSEWTRRRVDERGRKGVEKQKSEGYVDEKRIGEEATIHENLHTTLEFLANIRRFEIGGLKEVSFYYYNVLSLGIGYKQCTYR